jgi:hypothetical protein
VHGCRLTGDRHGWIPHRPGVSEDVMETLVARLKLFVGDDSI